MHAPSSTNKGVRFRYSYLTPQLDNTRVMESMLGITGLSYNFSFMSLFEKKNAYLRWYSRFAHRSTPDGSISDLFYSTFNKTYSVLVNLIDAIIVRYINRIHRLFVPKFYHDRSDWNFLKGFKYVGEKSTIDEKYFSETGKFGRKLHEYNKGSDIQKEISNKHDWLAFSRKI